MFQPDDIPENLLCPILGDLFEDPIQMPCCGKSISRMPVINWFVKSGKTCPRCRANLDSFDPITVVRNRDKADDVEEFKRIRSSGPAPSPALPSAAVAPVSAPLCVPVPPACAPVLAPRPQTWEAVVNPVMDSTGKVLPVSELKLTLEGASIIPKTTRFIPVMDRSGSMSGNPWRQVQAALRHIVALASTNPLVEVDVIAYESYAQIVNLGHSLDTARNAIDSLNAGGGTNDRSAFDKVSELLNRYHYSGPSNIPCPPYKTEVGSITIVFLTDGCSDGLNDDASRYARANELRTILAEKWAGAVTVHAVGFSQSCDRVYLEEMWKTGHDDRGAPLHGIFRFAEPTDDSDMLSRKISGLFEMASRASTVPLEIRQTIGDFIEQKLQTGKHLLLLKDECPRKMDLSESLRNRTRFVQFPIDANGKGSYSCWISHQEAPNLTDDNAVFINIGREETPETPVPLIDGYKQPNYKLIRNHLYARWISYLTDKLASQLLEHSKVDKVAFGIRAYGLVCLVIDRTAQALRAALATSASQDSTIQRLDIISRDALALNEGLAINAGRLGDLRSGAGYIASKSVAPSVPAIQPASTATLALPQVTPASYDETTPQYVRYGQASLALNRNALQQQIVQLDCDMMKRLIPLAVQIRQAIASATFEQLDHVDQDGNNALMLAAYCGHRTLTEAILHRMSQTTPGGLDDQFEQWLETKNLANETALTLAVKARGYDDTVNIILKAGAQIPGDRQDALYRYCLDHRFRRTAKLMVNPSSVVTQANATMTEDYLEVAFNSGAAKPESLAKMNLWSYLDTAIKKRLPNLAQLVIATAASIRSRDVTATPTLPEPLASSWDPLNLTAKSFEELCILDDTIPALVSILEELGAYLKLVFPDTQIELAETGVIHPRTCANLNPGLLKFINTPINEAGDTLLFRAADRGSPKLLAMCLHFGANIDQPNALGNTPLWIACERRYPCLIDALLAAGANPDHTNLKGNSPMTTICQKGPKANAERLLATRRVNVDNVNRNGDTLILICCRNGQAEVLKLLLERAEAATVNHIAHIDGFGAMHASVEANRPECVRILHEYGLSLEIKTASDNQIIAGATPLHLAAYYGRAEAMQMLLELGADANALDVHGQTPLHTAVIRGSADANSGTTQCLKLLRGRCNALLRDKQGNTAASYCRDESLRKLLVDPLVEPMMNLSRGTFAGKEQLNAIEILKGINKIDTGLDASTLLSLRNNDGHTPLIEAIIYGNQAMIDTYLALDQNVMAQDYSGLDACTWAHIFGNVRLRTRLAQLLNPTAPLTAAQLEAQPAMQSLQLASRDPLEARILFPGARPNAEQLARICSIEHTHSSIGARMATTVEHMHGGAKDHVPTANAEPSKPTPDQATPPAAAKTLVPMENANAFVESLSWDAKLFTISKVASYIPGDSRLLPSAVAALYMYDSLGQATMQGIASQAPEIRGYVSVLESAFEQIKPYEGETYLGVPNLPDRSKFRLGATFRLDTLMSASSSWCVAAEHAPDFSVKRQGVIFIIHGKTGRSIARFSRFTYDMEVLFPVGAAFRVVNWYRGDVICLGQANIREHTFRIKEEELPRYLSTNAALIIELVQV